MWLECMRLCSKTCTLHVAHAVGLRGFVASGLCDGSRECIYVLASQQLLAAAMRLLVHCTL